MWLVGRASGVVLVVDRQRGEPEGYDVVVASGGEEGLAASGARIDCVLLDIRMPGLDGFETCRRMRAIAGTDLPVLFLTAQCDVETFDRATEVGGDDYITKPIRSNELVARVASAIKVRGMAIERGERYDLIRKQRDDLMRLQPREEQLRRSSCTI